MDEEGRPVVVVGVDGSRDADAALRHAVREAHRRDGRVLAVAAADSPVLAAGDVESLPVNPEAVRESTERRVGAHVDELLAGLTDVDPVGLGCVLHAPCPVTVVRVVPFGAPVPEIATADAVPDAATEIAGVAGPPAEDR